ncbi:vesicle-associated protein 1-1-like, partial [Olea europaea var. sylvestris]|uniref:vesicle-associated protein 1-1-like n=1 Tax=Olea europaea var. sylvestris TaxID=158386 RepID=UPI000C1D365B
TMQAQKSAPDSMQCKDKFLIQLTIVPYGTTEAEITSGMFAKDSDRYIEERKLWQEPSNDTSISKEKLQSRVEHLPPTQMLVKNVADAKMTTSMEELILPNVVENVKSVPAENNKLKTDNDEDSAKQ